MSAASKATSVLLLVALLCTGASAEPEAEVEVEVEAETEQPQELELGRASSIRELILRERLSCENAGRFCYEGRTNGTSHAEKVSSLFCRVILESYVCEDTAERLKEFESAEGGGGNGNGNGTRNDFL